MKIVPAEVSAPNHTTRSVVTLCLLLHGICLVSAFAGMFNTSPIQQRLVRVLDVYLRPLHLNPGRAWHLDAHLYFVVLQPTARNANNSAAIIPANERLSSLAATVAKREENEEFKALVAKSLGESLLRRHQLSTGRLQIRHGKTAAIRVRDSEVVYEGDIWFGDDGARYFQKHVEPPDAAPAVVSP
jgi:hypothetical protein